MSLTTNYVLEPVIALSILDGLLQNSSLPFFAMRMARSEIIPNNVANPMPLLSLATCPAKRYGRQIEASFFGSEAWDLPVCLPVPLWTLKLGHRGLWEEWWSEVVASLGLLSL